MWSTPFVAITPRLILSQSDSIVKYTDAGKYETLTTLCCSGTKHLLTSWLKFFNTKRERHNFYYADCTIWPNKCAAHPVASSWTGLAQSWISINSFSKSPNSQPITPGHDVIHTPVPFSIWGFYNDICDCHILCAWAWTVLNVCGPALRAE